MIGMQKIDNKTVLVTGGAGFVGSNLVAQAIDKAKRIVVYDNLSSGKYNLIKNFDGRKNFRFVKGDLLDAKLLNQVMKEERPDVIAHLAANPDIRLGTKNAFLDLEQGPIATNNLLEAARQNDVNAIIYSSSSVVYGRAKRQPTPETYGPLAPISLYGASKLACEGLITAYNGLYGIDYYIHRFANVVGNNQSHGVIFDFMNKLRENGSRLKVLGNGKQKKSYMDVIDCVNAIVFVYEKDKNVVLNLATTGQTEVSTIAKEVIARVAPGAKIEYTGTEQGWPGDVPNTHLDSAMMRRKGIKLTYKISDEAVMHAINLACKTMR
ncbi:MAG: NAD-dependent epimerase/dehydratase family protein [Candidatus Micrarchaeota archaeon]|nr:NAD-dependent epimerase/dehydratase family protein [Candidatus Micrarchaeota archaeon]